MSKKTTANESAISAETLFELPDLNDVEHPILKRAIERLNELKKGKDSQNGVSLRHQKHSSHDRTGHQSAYW